MTGRVIRYVEIDPSGRPFHEATSTWEGGPDEAAAWALLVADATQKGNRLVRLENGRYAENPRLEDIEGDGMGGFRAKPGRVLRNVAVMKDA